MVTHSQAEGSTSTSAPHTLGPLPRDSDRVSSAFTAYVRPNGAAGTGMSHSGGTDTAVGFMEPATAATAASHGGGSSSLDQFSNAHNRRQYGGGTNGSYSRGHSHSYSHAAASSRRRDLGGGELALLPSIQLQQQQQQLQQLQGSSSHGRKHGHTHGSTHLLMKATHTQVNGQYAGHTYGYGHVDRYCQSRSGNYRLQHHHPSDMDPTNRLVELATAAAAAAAAAAGSGSGSGSASPSNLVIKCEDGDPRGGMAGGSMDLDPETDPGNGTNGVEDIEVEEERGDGDDDGDGGGGADEEGVSEDLDLENDTKSGVLDPSYAATGRATEREHLGAGEGGGLSLAATGQSGQSAQQLAAAAMLELAKSNGGARHIAGAAAAAANGSPLGVLAAATAGALPAPSPLLQLLASHQHQGQTITDLISLLTGGASGTAAAVLQHLATQEHLQFVLQQQQQQQVALLLQLLQGGGGGAAATASGLGANLGGLAGLLGLAGLGGGGGFGTGAGNGNVLNQILRLLGPQVLTGLGPGGAQGMLAALLGGGGLNATTNGSVHQQFQQLHQHQQQPVSSPTSSHANPAAAVAQEPLSNGQVANGQTSQARPSVSSVPASSWLLPQQQQPQQQQPARTVSPTSITTTMMTAAPTQPPQSQRTSSPALPTPQPQQQQQQQQQQSHSHEPLTRQASHQLQQQQQASSPPPPPPLHQHEQLHHHQPTAASGLSDADQGESKAPGSPAETVTATAATETTAVAAAAMQQSYNQFADIANAQLEDATDDDGDEDLEDREEDRDSDSMDADGGDGLEGFLDARMVMVAAGEAHTEKACQVTLIPGSPLRFPGSHPPAGRSGAAGGAVVAVGSKRKAGALRGGTSSAACTSNGNGSGGSGGEAGGGGGDEQNGSAAGEGAEGTCKAPKKPRINWSQELHARFLNAMFQLGIKNAVPKTILQLMNVEGLTRENVASHLQKYRILLKRHAQLPANAPLNPDNLKKLEVVQQAVQQSMQQSLGIQTSGPNGGGQAALINVTVGGGIGGTLSYQDLISQLSAMTTAHG
ncbi:hypothetical protein VaNZ11_001641, partial [Volvox africanus]